MAIVQISKIVHRTGAYTDLPQLDIGEIGFATDEQRVFIGNDPDIVPPANVNSTTQTEILTTQSYLDFSRITGTSNSSIDINSVSLDAGQVLVSNVVTGVGNVWENYTGNLLGPNADVKLNLGSEANLSITGGVNGYVLTTDGTGNLSWMPGAGGGGGGSPTGSNTQVQFNNSGSFGSAAEFTYDYVAQALTVSGIVYATTVVANSQGKFDGVIGNVTPGVATFTSVTINNNANITYTLTAGNVQSANVKLLYNSGGSNWHMFANADGIFCTDSTTSTTYQVNLTAV